MIVEFRSRNLEGLFAGATILGSEEYNHRGHREHRESRGSIKGYSPMPQALGVIGTIWR